MNGGDDLFPQNKIPYDIINTIIYYAHQNFTNRQYKNCGSFESFLYLKFLADIQGKISETEIREAMSKVGLDPDNNTKVSNYSLGMKQKLGLAQAMMEGQDILVLDEPFNALDYHTYEDVKSIIRMLKAEGKTIFLTSHHYQDVEQLCDRIYAIEQHHLIPITQEIAARYQRMG